MRRLLAPLLIVLAVFAAYAPVLRYGVVWNDADYITAPALRSAHGLLAIWFHPGATEQYYPVLHTAFWIEHRLWGGAPAGYHLANLVLHAVAAILFARALLAVWGEAPEARRAAWFGALLFAVHPMMVESVAWIAEQKNTLSTVFYLLAALAGWRAGVANPGRPLRLGGWYAAATACFALAVLSKSVTATLPGALLVLAWYRRGRLSWRQDVAPLLPWLAIGAADGLFTAWVERHSLGAAGPEFALDPAQRLLIAARALWFYAGKLIWPHPLVFMYPRWHVDPSRPESWAPVLGVLLVLGLGVAGRRRRRGPLAAALLFAGALFPVLGWFNVYAFVFSFVADHFAYLAALPALAAVAWLWGRWTDVSGVSLRAGVGLAALVAGAAIRAVRAQAADYRDEATLYRRTLEKNPDAWLAQYNYGNLLRAAGRSDEARAHYEAARASNPGHAGIENNLGLALVETGHPAEALPHFAAARRLEPRYAAAENNLGLAYALLHRPAEAIVHYRAAVELRRSYPEAWYNLGLALAGAGRTAAAASAFAEATRQRPGWPAATEHLATAHNQLGIEAWQAGRRAEAVAEFRDAARLEPNSSVFADNLRNARKANP